MNILVAQRIVVSTPLLRRVERIEHLAKWYSTDRKYVLWEDSTPRYLLRLSDIEFHERRQADFGMLSRHHERGVLCPKPLSFEVTDDGKVC